MDNCLPSHDDGDIMGGLSRCDRGHLITIYTTSYVHDTKILPISAQRCYQTLSPTLSLFPAMLSVPSRPVGLPTSPRPQKKAYSAQNSPVHAPLDLPPVRSRPDRLSPATSSLHTRSHSQPPRIISSPKHGRSASTTPHRYEEDDLYKPMPPHISKAPARPPSLVDYEDDSEPGMQSRGQTAAAPYTQRLKPEIPYTRPATRT
jgi:hypothetical protein